MCQLKKYWQRCTAQTDALRDAGRGSHAERAEHKKHAVERDCHPPAIVHHQGATKKGAKDSADFRCTHDELILPFGGVKLLPAQTPGMSCHMLTG